MPLAPRGGPAKVPPVNLDVLRSFFAISELGSLSKAARQLHVSQSTLTRQVQSLEAEVGGAVFDRGPQGVALTAAGHVLLDGMRPIVRDADGVLAEARKLARGQSSSVRIGYLLWAAPEYLNPAVAALRRAHPKTKVHLVDLPPGEQIEALRRGDLDVLLVGNLNAAIAREFFVRRVATFPVVVALPESHPLAARKEIALRDLRGQMFVGGSAERIPGFTPWLLQLCRRAGFRPKITELARGMTHTLSLVVSEDAVTILPALIQQHKTPGVTFRPLRGVKATWDLQVAWHRGRITEAVRELVRALTGTG